MLKETATTFGHELTWRGLWPQPKSNRIRSIKKYSSILINVQYKRKDATMKLMELYQDKIMGAIKGLDRIRFRGTLRLLANQNGLRSFMSYTNILLKDFSGWVENLTGMIRKSCEARADELGIKTRYLGSSRIEASKKTAFRG